MFWKKTEIVRQIILLSIVAILLFSAFTISGLYMRSVRDLKTAQSLILRDQQVFDRFMQRLAGYEAALGMASKTPEEEVATYPEVQESAQRQQITRLFQKMTVPDSYLKNLEESSYHANGSYILITDKPGHLFVSSGGPATPEDDPETFVDGVQIRIFPSDKKVFDHLPRLTPTAHRGVWQDIDSCEAGCWGAVYVVDGASGYFTVQVDSNNFNEKKLEVLVDSVLDSVANTF